MKKQRGNKGGDVWQTIDECAYSSTGLHTHVRKMRAARKNAADAAMENLHLHVAYTPRELSQMVENLAYYVVQVEKGGE